MLSLVPGEFECGEDESANEEREEKKNGSELKLRCGAIEGKTKSETAVDACQY